MVPVRDRLARDSSGSEAKRFRYLWATGPPELWIIRRTKLSIDMFTTNHKLWLAFLLFATALAFTNCAALQPPNATGPRGNEALYPILFTEDSHRKEAITVALNRFAVQAGTSDSTEAQLPPVTATILNISPKANSNLYLPKVGATAVMTEEETRESLRRFIREWQELIGADPAKLSLVERVDQPDGSKLANYEQRPFRYPIRGNYGKLQIRFTADRRVLSLTSSCIPDAERIQTSISAYSVRLRSREAIQQLREKGLAYTDAKGTKLSIKVPAASEITPRGLVIYVLAAKDKPDALEFHLAWEMELGNAPVKIAYIDAINGETVAVE
jgi:hypothetical protein